jgi:hypothetical protein
MPRVQVNRPTIDSCRLVLNAHELRANGCLRPGWSGRWRIEGGSGGGDGKAKVSIHLRAEADRLHLSWDPRSVSDSVVATAADSGEVESGSGGDDEISETVSLAHFSNHFGRLVKPGAPLVPLPAGNVRTIVYGLADPRRIAAREIALGTVGSFLDREDSHN